jgi:hypothetical protein
MKDALVLKAPQAGIVLSPPKIDEVGKLWDKDQSAVFCSIGDPTQLRVLVPVSPADYRLLDDDAKTLQARGYGDNPLDVTIRVQGRDSQTWRGELMPLPQSEAKEVPLHLSNKAGGPVAVRPGGDPNHLIPQSQQYLVSISIMDSDRAIQPGTMAQAKVHCCWRTCAWWTWQWMASTFDLGLW